MPERADPFSTDQRTSTGRSSSQAAAAPLFVTEDLDALLNVLPPSIRGVVRKSEDTSALLEVVLDIGRLPEARYTFGARYLADIPVVAEDLTYVVERIGEFGGDNRAGIERTLHRISAIRNRRGEVIGLTCRVGRAVRGTVALIRDVIDQGRSILILGRPGVGKTTLLREAARVLADELGKRVVVVDTSNEIAGDGDVPHPGIGRARRMQVARPAEQHQVMIEAVENHMPEVIVIDEIGTELEAAAARTIAERGVQLVGTAHGRTLENLLMNPTLSDLVGGVQAVTLGDEEARRRGTQKTVLERKAPPTFDVLVEQEERNLVGVHLDVAEAVDEILRGDAPIREMRERQADGSMRRWAEHVTRETHGDGSGMLTRELPVQRVDLSGRRGGQASAMVGPRTESAWWEQRPERQPTRKGRPASEVRWLDPELARGAALMQSVEDSQRAAAGEGGQEPVLPMKRLLALGVNRTRLEQAIRELGLPIVVTRDDTDVDAVLVLKSMYRKQPDRVQAAQAAGVPVYVLRGSSLERLRETLAEMFRPDMERMLRASPPDEHPE